MHDGSQIVGDSVIVHHLRRDAHKIAQCHAVDILLFDPDVIVPVVSILLMPEAQCVRDFMRRYADGFAPIADRNPLLSAAATDVRIASASLHKRHVISSTSSLLESQTSVVFPRLYR
jgi:hypothetical protein